MVSSRPAPPRGSAAAGLAVTVTGALLVLVSFTSAAWYGGSGGPDTVGRVGFSALHRLSAGTGLPRVFFSWLGWALLVSLLVVGLAAGVAGGSAAAPGLRVLGLLLGLTAAALTYLALSRLTGGTDVFGNARSGVWLALGGYLLAGVGAALGRAHTRGAPRRV